MYENQTNNLKVLHIIGNSQGLDIRRDRNLVMGHFGDQNVDSIEPKCCRELSCTLTTEVGYNLLIYSGHTSQGKIFLSGGSKVQITQLELELKEAIMNGLTMALFNSCACSEIGKYLAKIGLPIGLVMRAPIPDQVAHLWLEYLLKELAENGNLYLAFRAAKQQLKQQKTIPYPPGHTLPVLFMAP